MRDLAEQVGKQRLTTLGRLVADPDFRTHADFEIDGDTVKFHYDAAAMRALILKVLRDISGDFNVTELKKKPQRTDYIEKNLADA